MSLGTDCAHAGDEPIPSLTKPAVMPIYQTSVYDFPDLEVVDAVWESQKPGFIYGRYGSPNTHALESVLARLERGESALASASRLITDTRPQAVQSVLNAKSRAVVVETISNPLWNVVDIPALAEVCRGKGVKLLVDNTSATPCIVRPLELGADVVIHSATKFLGGHHDVTAGILVGDHDFVARARDIAIRLGPSLAAFDAWLAVRGIKTLALRMERACANAVAVARFLEGHAKVTRVYYPGLESHPQYEIVRRTMKGNGGAMLSFEIKGDLRTTEKFVKSLSMIRFAPSFGGLTTTVSHPGKTSHRSLTPGQRAEVGITDTLIRLSLGIEDAADIIAELETALGQ